MWGLCSWSRVPLMWRGESCAQKGQPCEEGFLQNLWRNWAIHQPGSWEGGKSCCEDWDTQRTAAHTEQPPVTNKKKKDKHELFKESDTLKPQNHKSIWDPYSPQTSTWKWFKQVKNSWATRCTKTNSGTTRLDYICCHLHNTSSV